MDTGLSIKKSPETALRNFHTAQSSLNLEAGPRAVGLKTLSVHGTERSLCGGTQRLMPWVSWDIQLWASTMMATTVDTVQIAVTGSRWASLALPWSPWATHSRKEKNSCFTCYFPLSSQMDSLQDKVSFTFENGCWVCIAERHCADREGEESPLKIALQSEG